MHCPTDDVHAHQAQTGERDLGKAARMQAELLQDQRCQSQAIDSGHRPSGSSLPFSSGLLGTHVLYKLQ